MIIEKGNTSWWYINYKQRWDKRQSKQNKMTPPTSSRAVTMMNQLTFHPILILPSVHQSTRLMFHLFLIFFLCLFAVSGYIRVLMAWGILISWRRKQKKENRGIEVGQTFHMVDRHILKIHCLFASFVLSFVVKLSCRVNISTNTTNSATLNRLLSSSSLLLSSSPPSSPPSPPLLLPSSLAKR